MSILRAKSEDASAEDSQTLESGTVSVFESAEPSVRLKELERENALLREKLRKYSSIVDFLPIPIWVRDENLDIQFCNHAYADVVESTPEKVVTGKGVELSEEVRVLARHAHETGDLSTSEIHIVSGGERKLFRIAEVPVLGSGIMVGTAYDVSEQEKAEAEIQLYVSSQSDLMESSNSAMAIFGADTRIRFFNNSYAKLWFLDPEWLSSHPTYGEILEQLREYRRMPEQTNFPQFKKNQIRLFNELLEPTEDFDYLPDGTALRTIVIPHALGGLLFVYEDVTDKLDLERSYNTLIKVQKATLDYLHQGVAVFREDGRLRLSNPTFAELWGMEPEFIMREPHADEFIERCKELFIFDGDWEVFKAQQVSDITAQNQISRRLERTDGKVLEFRAVPLPDGATMLTYLDVTDSTLLERSLRDRNKALEEADRIKTEFLANVSYELRSPLTSILGFAEILKNNYFGELTEKQIEYMEGIYNSSKQLKELIDDILDVASIEAGYFKLNHTTFDIGKMLRNVLMPVKESARERKLSFKLNCSSKIGMMRADEIRIKQAIYNLLSNAVKFTPDGGTITVGADDVKGKPEVRLWVEDTGSGIAPEEQEAVFRKFYKSGEGKLHKSGTGLGLTLVKNFIELHHGRIKLSSKPGSGTLIECFLPKNI